MISALRRRDLVCLTSPETGNERAIDEDQLRFATGQACVIGTSNQGHFARLHRDWLVANRSHAGIIVVRQDLEIRTRLKRLTTLMAALSPEVMRDRIEYLNNWPED